MPENKSSFFVTNTVASTACEMAREVFSKMWEKGLPKRDVLVIVIMDPAKTPANSTFPEALLHTYIIGEPDSRFSEVALSKAEVSWRTGMDSHLVQQIAPYLYSEGDTPYGGAVCRDGLVVAASGVEWYFDQSIAEVVAAMIKALCLHGMDIIMEDHKDFLGD